jgi:signal transduction histidine kinase
MRPLLRALEVLSSRSDEIHSAWRLLLRQLSPGREEYETLSKMDLQGHYRRLRGKRPEGYDEAVRAEGFELTRRGVPEDHAIAAVAFYLESCLTHLVQEPDQRTLARALVRLTMATQRLLVIAYRRERGARSGFDEKERRSLSRDLHDEVGADLVVLKLYIEMIAMELARGNVAPIGPKLEEAMELVAHAIDSVRRLTLDLGPAVLEQLGFRSGLKLFTRQFSARTGIEVELRDTGLPEAIPSTHETTLYRVLQGALSNVAKHARAHKVKVSIGAVKEAVIVMIVEDDGMGFDVAGRLSQGFGLTTMRERIESLGGRLHVESRTARGGSGRSGTRLEIDLPITPREGS